MKSPLPSAWTCNRDGKTLARGVEAALNAKQEFQLQRLAIDRAAIVANLDEQGRFTYANDRFCSASGYSRSELVGSNHGLLSARIQSPALLQSIYRAIARGRVWQGELSNRTKDGRPFWVDATIAPRPGPRGEAGGCLLLGIDITPHKLLELDLERHRRRARQSADRLHVTLANLGEGVCLVDEDFRVIATNKLFLQINDLRASEVRAGVSLGEALDGTAGAYLIAHLAACSDGDRLLPDEWAVHEHPNGRAISAAAHHIDGGGFVITCRDVTAHHAHVRQIAHMADHDAVTGLANRVRLAREIDGAMQRCDRQAFALLLLDLDHFKAINDTLGHVFGDRVLRAVSEKLLDTAGAEAVVARIGGDEFAILAPIESKAAAADLAARLTAAVAQNSMTLDGEPVCLGASVGIAMLPKDARRAEELFTKADLALYHAKSAGRATFAMFSRQMGSQLVKRRAMISDLKSALRRKQLSLHYQPVVSTADGRTVGAEALLRWKHPQRGWVSPQQFIPLAEETHLIDGIGEWVLRTACRTAARWPGDITLAVNLSPLQVKRGRLRDIVAGALADSGLAASRLELEITESVFLDTSQSVLTTLHDLRAMGVRIALDDFGTGYSALGYLQTFPFDKIKIDRSFVQNLGEAHRTSAIVAAVTGLARILDMEVVAEGVETAEQYQHVRAACCHHAQGYLFSAPLPAQKFASFIASRRQRKPAA